ncbi:MAG: alpha,alpha-trehalose-phosphate synthase (UDP-forming) [Acidimicrobiales bacterium]
MAEQPIVILSNRGPVSYSRDDAGALVARRGGGGLVSGVAPLVAGTDTIWLAAAMSNADREAATDGVAEADGLRVRLLDIDVDTYRAHYDIVCNATLWFAAHGLFDPARSPRLDAAWWDAWDAYREVNIRFANAAAEVAPPDAVVLVQDYHLALVAPSLVAARPDVRCAFFAHTPWCEPEGMFPIDPVATELLAAIAASHAIGFHAERWAGAFSRCLEHYGIAGGAATFVAPLGPEPDDVVAVAASDACRVARAALLARIGDRRVLVRVDRMELSKNILRGFAAYDELLTVEPKWRERVTFVALCYPSREGLPEYAAYRAEVEAAVVALNERWATPGWEPVVLETDDDFPRAIAALAIADVVLVNPVRDGLNLVAKEQALVSERAAALVLSTEAGAWDELGHQGALGINPFDVRATASALHAALEMDADERRRRHETIKARTLARSPRDWLAEQLAAVAPA